MAKAGSDGWGYKTIIGVVLIFALMMVYSILSNRGHTLSEKSIAVLPFINDTPGDSNKYFINGIMEEISNNLQKIEDIKIISRTAVEQYRNTTKSISEIAKELGINYIVEGTLQKYGNTFILGVQLVNAHKEIRLWTKSYEIDMKEVKELLSVQTQIAQTIASEINSHITP
jgi:TolB-like protein